MASDRPDARRADTPTVRIHYRRPPDRVQLYEQRLVLDAPDVKISLQEHTPISRPMVIAGRKVLEPASPVVWFTFPDVWHDIGRFHDARGRFTGWYANILTPVVLHRPGDDPAEWHTTDLFLDVWLGADGDLRLLDEDELAAAEAAGWVDTPTARSARHEAGRLRAAAESGHWPPPVAREWTLARARGLSDRDQSSSSTR